MTTVDVAPTVKPKLVLDMRAGTVIARQYATVRDEISREMRQEFACFIGSLAKQRDDKTPHRLDWWLEAPASRNPILSRLFEQLLDLQLLRRVIADSHPLPDTVLVDSTAMARCVDSLCRQTGVALDTIGPSPLTALKRRLRSAASPFRSMARILAEWLVIRWSKKNQRRTNEQPLIVVDTFVIPGCLEQDRYYPGLLENAGDERSAIRFVPEIMNMSLREIGSTARTLRGEDRQVLLKQDFLTLGDLIWSFGHLIRVGKTLPARADFLNLDVIGLVRADIARRTGFRCALRGLLNYRFAQRLKSERIDVKTVIDWYENHPMDRGWNAGFKSAFPDAISRGYIGFYPAGQAYRPTEFEQSAGILPDEFLTIGLGFGEDLFEFMGERQSSAAPAFRYPKPPHLDQKQPGQKLVLVAMPYYLDLCQDLLKILLTLKQQHRDWHFVVKAHPARPLDDVTNWRALVDAGAEPGSAPLNYLLRSASVMVAGAQGTTVMESAAWAVPAVLLSKSGQEVDASLPRVLPESLYTLCTDSACVTKAIKSYLESTLSLDQSRRDDALEFQRRCFTPVNHETVHQMLAA